MVNESKQIQVGIDQIYPRLCTDGDNTVVRDNYIDEGKFHVVYWDVSIGVASLICKAEQMTSLESLL
jgi:hypothetical protein